MLRSMFEELRGEPPSVGAGRQGGGHASGADIEKLQQQIKQQRHEMERIVRSFREKERNLEAQNDELRHLHERTSRLLAQEKMKGRQHPPSAGGDTCSSCQLQ